MKENEFAPAVLTTPRGVAHSYAEGMNKMQNNTQKNKTFAESEREQLRELFKEKARSPPIPNPFDADSLRKWDEYCQEMQDLEEALREAGEEL